MVGTGGGGPPRRQGRWRLPRDEVLVGEHPLVDLFEHQGIAPGGIGGRVGPLRMGLAPEDAEPERHPEVVLGLGGPQQAEVLVGGDQVRQGAVGEDARALDLLS